MMCFWSEESILRSSFTPIIKKATGHVIFALVKRAKKIIHCAFAIAARSLCIKTVTEGIFTIRILMKMTVLGIVLVVIILQKIPLFSLSVFFVMIHKVQPSTSKLKSGYTYLVSTGSTKFGSQRNMIHFQARQETLTFISLVGNSIYVKTKFASVQNVTFQAFESLSTLDVL